MKQRVFLVAAFAVGIAVAIYYTTSFLQQHPLDLSSFRPQSWPYFAALMVLAVILQVCGHALRAHKSRYLLNPIRETNTKLLFGSLSVGYLFNTLLPLRIGELIRAFHLGDKLAISKISALISVVIERIVDGVLLGISLVSASIIIRSVSTDAANTSLSFGIGLLVVSLALALILALMRAENRFILRGIYHLTALFNDRIRDRLRFVAWSAVYSTRLMLSAQTFRKRYLFLSVGMWGLYFASTTCVIVAFFGGQDISKLWFGIQSVYAGVSQALGPGYIGSFQLTVSDLLQGVSAQTTTGAFGVIMWLVIIAPISLVGLCVLLLERQSGKSQSDRQLSLINKLHRERDISSEFSHFLDAYLQGEQINKLLSHAELDNKFKLIRSFKGGSKAHTMLTWQDNEVRVKKITLLQYADKLVDQANWLRQRQELPHLPRVIAEERTNSYYSFDLDFRETYLPFFDFIHSNKGATNNAIVSQVLTFARENIHKAGKPTKHTADLESYIKSKVLGKIQDTSTLNGSLRSLLAEKHLVINGKEYTNLLQAIDKLKRHPQAMKELARYPECVIHGDFTIDNLIVSPDADFLLLDPNNENQVSTPAVDYGKLYQSLHSGYEFLIQLKECDVKGNNINFVDSRSQKYASLYRYTDKELRNTLPAAEYRSILFHEAVHYCRMLTYRANINPDTLVVFYAVATKLFNEHLEQYE